MEHMAFSVVGRWGEQGVTTIRITELGEASDGHFSIVEPQDGLPGLPIQKARVGSSQNLS